MREPHLVRQFLLLSLALLPISEALFRNHLDPSDVEAQDAPLQIRTPRATDKSVLSVLSRLPGWISEEFSSFEITSESREITEGSAQLIGTMEGVRVVATSPVDALYAIHAYLREFCGTMITWEGENVSKNGECKRPEEFERSFRSPKVRYFGNPCTFSYSFAWWDWSHWERFIDWLALSGFNMMLAPVGQETIWAELWTELGISQKGLNEFFPGPAYLSWHRMGNVQALGGSMTPEYLESQLELNKKIVKRMVQLGIVPVLPTFAGFVPKEFERKFDQLRYLHNACWNRLNETYSCTTSLHPQEPEFKTIAKAFIDKQRSIYGDVTDVYSADPFNESPPPHLKDGDFSNMADSIYQGCVMGNSRCVWLLQSWTFVYDAWAKSSVRAFLGQVPKGRMIILDLQAEKRPLYKEFEGFYGHHFVWCLLQNFGGNTQMRGNLGKLHENYRSALASESSMAGMGLTMEGINQNYIVYQYLIDLAWTEEELDPQPWVASYASARYGTRSKLQTDAWNMLLATYYTQVDIKSMNEFGVVEISQLNEREERREIYLYYRPRFSQTIRYWFPSELIEKLGKSFALLNRTLGGNELFRQDFADVMREVIQNKLDKRIQYATTGYALQDRKIMKKACMDMEVLFEQLDRNEVRDLSDWILQAREAARPETEADSFERQARNQITLWGPRGEIVDYARKEWKGLIRKFYSKRWGIFCEVIQSGARFSEKKLDERLLREVELPFGHL
ncbi:hypothetical protein PRIPAC_95244 [Pristionchus pacificus]|uniref:Uncharacterized protein n=1 Tax=Pristionchus pacificus TaxID=54126 RepID=A0A2A6BJA8_PRIPA|nr:hypothetical protein PRIPAC_95244 [Pristionchus pacificus]|eukprot:PDM65995.1 hypothetical protein PRIPAC_44089 [Pristionchus pacificus]